MNDNTPALLFLLGMVFGMILSGVLSDSYQTSYYESRIVAGEVSVDGGAHGRITYQCGIPK